jgi:rubredoxin
MGLLANRRSTMVSASLSISIDVTCPECGHYFDLADTNLNEEGWIYQEALPEKDWHTAHENFKCSATCPHCSVEFPVGRINW